MSYYSEDELKELGFKSCGQQVRISRKASFYGANNISIGSNVRIDDFCVLSAGDGGISMGNYIHLAVYSSIIGKGPVTIEDYANISSRVSIYSSNDDYSGAAMTNPTIPSNFTNVTSAHVKVCKHVIIGSGSIVLPGVTIEMGAAIGAMSLINKDCKQFGVYMGIPAKWKSERKKDLLAIEKKFINGTFST